MSTGSSGSLHSTRRLTRGARFLLLLVLRWGCLLRRMDVLLKRLNLFLKVRVVIKWLSLFLKWVSLFLKRSSLFLKVRVVIKRLRVVLGFLLGLHLGLLLRTSRPALHHQRREFQWPRLCSILHGFPLK